MPPPPPRTSVIAFIAAGGFAAWAALTFAHGSRGGDVTSLVILAGVAATVGVGLWRRRALRS